MLVHVLKASKIATLPLKISNDEPAQFEIFGVLARFAKQAEHTASMSTADLHVRSNVRGSCMRDATDHRDPVSIKGLIIMNRQCLSC